MSQAAVKSGAVSEELQTPLCSDTQLFYKLFFLSACLILFLMPGSCVNIDDYLKMLSLSEAYRETPADPIQWGGCALQPLKELAWASLVPLQWCSAAPRQQEQNLLFSQPRFQL